MHHYASLISSFSSILLMSVIYYCNFLTAKDSRLRNQTLQMIMLALLTGMASIAVPAALVGVVRLLTDGISLATILNGGIEIASIAMISATFMLFRSAVKRTNLNSAAAGNVAPFTPRPVSPTTGRGALKKAA